MHDVACGDVSYIWWASVSLLRCQNAWLFIIWLCYCVLQIWDQQALSSSWGASAHTWGVHQWQEHTQRSRAGLSRWGASWVMWFYFLLFLLNVSVCAQQWMTFGLNVEWERGINCETLKWSWLAPRLALFVAFLTVVHHQHFNRFSLNAQFSSHCFNFTRSPKGLHSCVCVSHGAQ